MNEDIYIEYKEYLKDDYAKNCMEIIYDEINNIFKKIYLYNCDYGTIEAKNSKKEIHIWESEDNAQSGSYLNKHYPVICLNGKVNDPEVEENIIRENLSYIDKLNIEKEKIEIINNAMNYLRRI
jgi:hypothetical protein